jgi:hypothetical protein
VFVAIAIKIIAATCYQVRNLRQKIDYYEQAKNGSKRYEGQFNYNPAGTYIFYDHTYRHNNVFLFFILGGHNYYVDLDGNVHIYVHRPNTYEY